MNWKRNDDATGEQRAAAVSLIFRGQQPLDDNLVRAVAGHGEKKRRDEPGPDR